MSEITNSDNVFIHINVLARPLGEFLTMLAALAAWIGGYREPVFTVLVLSTLPLALLHLISTWRLNRYKRVCKRLDRDREHRIKAWSRLNGS
jgi:hypothetical protein